MTQVPLAPPGSEGAGLAARPWSVPGWRSVGSPGSVRFGSLYRDREWQEQSARFEDGLAQALMDDAEQVAVAERAFDRLYDFLVRRHGERGADLAFFPSDHLQQESGRGALDFLASRPGAWS